MSRVGIFGTGAYGISLAILSNRNKHDVIMWTKFPNERDYILTNHENTVLPGIKIDPSIKVTSEKCDYCGTEIDSYQEWYLDTVID